MKSQQEAGYGRGSPMRHCGVCRHFDSANDACSQVEGTINAYGVSSEFGGIPNPFGSKIGPKEAQMIDAMTASDPDQSESVMRARAPASTARIGSKTYEG